jgi:hypothetical protein
LPSFGFGWAFNVGGTGQDVGKSITTDTSGDLYLTGWYLSSTVNFDPNHTNPNNPNNTLTNPNSGGVDLQFAAKYTSSKTFQWATLLGRGNEFSGDIAVDGAGNVYVAFVDESNNYTHVAKLDAGSGTMRWNISFSGSTVSDTGGPHAGVAVGPSGDLYVTGRNASAQGFVAKLDPTGNVLWNQSLGTSSTEGLGVAVDSAEHVYVAYVTVTASAGSTKKKAPPPVYNIAVASLNAASGGSLWSGNVGNYGSTGAGIAADGAGNVYVAGGAGPFFVAKFTPANNGSLAQSWNVQFSGNDWASGLAVDDAGNVYTTGSFEGSVDFDPGPGAYILQGAGIEDIFVSELDTNGNFVAAADIVRGVPPDNPSSAEYGHGIALDGAGNIYTTGGFRGMANFNPTGTYDLTTNGYQDVFVSQLTQSSIQPSATRGATTLVDAANLERALTFLFVPGSFTDAALSTADSGLQRRTEILPVTQEAFGTSLERVAPMKTGHAALPTTMSPGMVDWYLPDLVSCALADTLAADTSLALLA